MHCPEVSSHVCVASHGAQAAPLEPHSLFVSSESDTHEPLSQQPEHAVPAQVQAPPEHAWLPSHAAQASPPVPHSLLVCEAKSTHEAPSQQPVAHEIALQMHWPVEVSHVWPPVHATQATPPLPHASVVSLASGTHVEPTMQPEHAWPDPELEFDHELHVELEPALALHPELDFGLRLDPELAADIELDPDLKLDPDLELDPELAPDREPDPDPDELAVPSSPPSPASS